MSLELITLLSKEDLIFLLEHDTLSGRRRRVTRTAAEKLAKITDLGSAAKKTIEDFDITAVESTLLGLRWESLDQRCWKNSSDRCVSDWGRNGRKE